MSRINIVFLIAFVGLLVWVFLFGQETVQRVQRGAMTFFKPFVAGAQKVEDAITEFGKEKPSVTDVQAQLDQVRRERDQLRLEVLRMDELAEENNALRESLNYVKNSPLQLVPARVIGRKPSTWYNTLIIDKGHDSNIAADSPVIVPIGENAGLIGKISEVQGRDSSVVVLLSDETCQVSARIQGSAEQGILSGQRGALRVMPDLKLKYLSKDAVVEAGREVISSGAGDLFPPNLLLGKIKDFKPDAITGEATVEPIVNFDVLKHVFVILPDTLESPDTSESVTRATPTSSP
ncbi:MAG: rod shape-determining protein MreC [Verrucomicrobiae bacterium]|nr:rod shape-determining protein MreC [Verrucomicrobiae bacterium]